MMGKVEDEPVEVIDGSTDEVEPGGALQNGFQQAVFLGLNSVPGLHVYEGTVPESEIAKRRAKNKVARQSRRRNRGTK